MGMFDYVHCDYPLKGFPDDYEPDSEDIYCPDFQTKSMYNALDHYYIDTGGNLYIKERKDGEWENEWEDVDYTGSMCFYVYSRGKRYEWTMLFESGKLVNYVFKEYNPRVSNER